MATVCPVWKWIGTLVNDPDGNGKVQILEIVRGPHPQDGHEILAPCRVGRAAAPTDLLRTHGLDGLRSKLTRGRGLERRKQVVLQRLQRLLVTVILPPHLWPHCRRPRRCHRLEDPMKVDGSTYSMASFRSAAAFSLPTIAMMVAGYQRALPRAVGMPSAMGSSAIA